MGLNSPRISEKNSDNLKIKSKYMIIDNNSTSQGVVSSISPRDLKVENIKKAVSSKISPRDMVK